MRKRKCADKNKDPAKKVKINAAAYGRIAAKGGRPKKSWDHLMNLYKSEEAVQGYYAAYDRAYERNIVRDEESTQEGKINFFQVVFAKTMEQKQKELFHEVHVELPENSKAELLTLPPLSNLPKSSEDFPRSSYDSKLLTDIGIFKKESKKSENIIDQNFIPDQQNEKKC